MSFFYFDANNNEDLTDDGPPRRLEIDPEDSVACLDLTFTLPTGRPWTVQIRGRGRVDDRISASIGRPVMAFAIRTNTARRGWWVPGDDSLPVEFFTPRPPSAGSMSEAIWFVFIDANRDGTVGAGDLTVLLANWGDC